MSDPTAPAGVARAGAWWSRPVGLAVVSGGLAALGFSCFIDASARRV